MTGLSLKSNHYKKIKITKIYGILLHRPHELLLENGDVLYESIMKLKENRLIEKIGVSVYSINDLMNIVDRFNIYCSAAYQYY